MKLSFPLYLKGLFLALIVVVGIFIFVQSAQAFTCSWQACATVWVPQVCDYYYACDSCVGCYQWVGFFYWNPCCECLAGHMEPYNCVGGYWETVCNPVSYTCLDGWNCSGDSAVTYKCQSGVGCVTDIEIDCNANNGWYSSGPCTEEERDYNCSGAGSCSGYDVTNTRNKADGTSCGINKECEGGSCVSSCDCDSGVCCDGCDFSPAGSQPTGWSDVYRCEGTNGPDSESRITFFDWYCSGADAGLHVNEEIKETCGLCQYCRNNEISCRLYTNKETCGIDKECDKSGSCVDENCGFTSSSGCRAECNAEGSKTGKCLCSLKSCSSQGWTEAYVTSWEAICSSLDSCCCTDPISLSASPGSDSVKQNKSVSTAIDVNLGYRGKTVSLSVVSPHPTIAISISPSSRSPGGSSTMYISTTMGTPVGTYRITVNGSYDRCIYANWPNGYQCIESVPISTIYTLQVEKGDNIRPTTSVNIKRQSSGEVVTNAFLREDAYRIQFTDSDNVGGSGLETCQYKIYSCDTDGNSCVEKEPITNRRCNGSIERGLGPSTSYNLDNGFRYLIYSEVADEAGNYSVPAYQYLRTDFTPPSTKIK